MDKRIVCRLCPHQCALREGQHGLCGARVARDGEVQSENYGCITSLALDPMEKKPLARFMPGTFVLSVGSFGCNLFCPFCQNASISTAGKHDVSYRTLSPQALVDIAQSARLRNNVGIAYTYNEPFISYEYLRDSASLAHDAGLVNVVVSNGMICSEPLEELLPLIDAANIDLKGFSQDFYDRVGGNFESVKRTIETLAACPSCHLEVTTLIIPGLNDTLEEIDAAASWLASLDPHIPYHLTRFFPAHRMLDRPPTPKDTLEKLQRQAKHYLDDVLLGNCF